MASTTGAARLDLDGDPIRPLRICMIGAGGFIGSHLFEKLMAETPHKVLAVDFYIDKIKNLLQPPPEHGRIQFHRLNIKNDSRLEGLIKMSDLVPPLQLPLRPRRRAPRPHFLQIRLSAGKIKHLFESPLGARPDPVPPTQHQERLPTRGPHQDFGSGLEDESFILWYQKDAESQSLVSPLEQSRRSLSSLKRGRGRAMVHRGAKRPKLNQRREGD